MATLSMMVFSMSSARAPALVILEDAAVAFATRSDIHTLDPKWAANLSQSEVPSPARFLSAMPSSQESSIVHITFAFSSFAARL